LETIITGVEAGWLCGGEGEGREAAASHESGKAIIIFLANANFSAEASSQKMKKKCFCIY